MRLRKRPKTMATNILGLITARGGSKRVPRKNIRDFLGKPLIAWSIDVGKESGVFDRFILSTDDVELAEVGKKYGVEVPFMRPQELATDQAGSFGVVKHAVEYMEKNEGFKADWIVLLEPPAPGRQVKHLKEVAALLETCGTDSIVGVTVTPGHFSPYKSLVKNDKGVVTRFGDNEILRNLIHRNQDVPPTYFINSAVYAFKYENLFDGNNSLWGNSTYGYEIDDKYAFDIDTEADWLAAEVKMGVIFNSA